MSKFETKTADPNIEETKNYVLRDIYKGLLSDVFNQWVAVRVISEKNIESLHKILTYEERLRDHEVSKPYADFIIQNSNASKIQKYNDLVSIFNAELPEIKKNKNYKRANEIAEQAFSLMKE